MASKTRMIEMRTKRYIGMWGVGILGVLLFLGSPHTAIATTFNLTDGGGDFAGGNLGTIVSATKNGLTLTLEALTGLADAGTDLAVFRDKKDDKNLPGTGTIFIGVNGAGVQDVDTSGSGGISGKGPLGDEQ